MTVISALVLFWMIWFITLLVMLPIGLQTQGEADQVVPGTPSSAPVDPMIGRKLLWATGITLALWLPLCALILWGGLTVRDIDIWHRM